MSEEWEDLEGPGSMVPYRTVVCSLTIPDEPDPVTTFIIAALAIACAALCVWLTVRIVNRRERWAKWTVVGLSLVLAYPLSFGPACWIADRCSGVWQPVWNVYYPLAAFAARAPSPISNALRDYGDWRSPAGIVPIAIELDAEAWINAHRQL